MKNFRVNRHCQLSAMPINLVLIRSESVVVAFQSISCLSIVGFRFQEYFRKMVELCKTYNWNAFRVWFGFELIIVVQDPKDVEVSNEE